MIKVDAAAYERLGADTKAFGKVLRASMRKELTVVGNLGKKAVQAKIRSMPVKGDVPYRQGGGLRRDIAAATRSSAAIAVRSGTNVTIRVGRTGALSAHNRWRVAQLMDRGDFRHPLFGEWVEGLPDQKGFPYFHDTLEELRPAMLAAANVAAREAAATLR